LPKLERQESLVMFHKGRSGIAGIAPHLRPYGPHCADYTYTPWWINFVDVLHEITNGKTRHPNIRIESASRPARSNHKSAVPYGDRGYSRLILYYEPTP
jgi:hypothetical protein